MCKEKVNNVDKAETVNNKVSLGKSIKASKEKISSITPKNPTISKDEAWRNEDLG